MECPDVGGCRDNIYERISKAEADCTRKVEGCAKDHNERLANKMSYKGVGTALTIAVAVLGLIFGIWNDAQSDAQGKVEARVEKLEEKDEDTQKKLENVETRLGAVETAVRENTEEGKKSRELLIKIGVKLGVEQEGDE